MKKPIPERIDLTEEEANRLIERINISNLSQADIKMVVGVIHFCLWLQVKLVEAKITIRKLAKFFGIRSEKRTKDNVGSKTDETNKESCSDEIEGSFEKDAFDNELADKNKKKGKNHGRLAAKSYTGAAKIG